MFNIKEFLDNYKIKLEEKDKQIGKILNQSFQQKHKKKLTNGKKVTKIIKKVLYVK